MQVFHVAQIETAFIHFDGTETCTKIQIPTQSGKVWNMYTVFSKSGKEWKKKARAWILFVFPGRPYCLCSALPSSSCPLFFSVFFDLSLNISSLPLLKSQLKTHMSNRPIYSRHWFWLLDCPLIWFTCFVDSLSTYYFSDESLFRKVTSNKFIINVSLTSFLLSCHPIVLPSLHLCLLSYVFNLPFFFPPLLTFFLMSLLQVLHFLLSFFLYGLLHTVRNTDTEWVHNVPFPLGLALDPNRTAWYGLEQVGWVSVTI